MAGGPEGGAVERGPSEAAQGEVIPAVVSDTLSTMPSELSTFSKVASHLANPSVLIGLGLLLLFGVHRAPYARGSCRPSIERRAA